MIVSKIKDFELDHSIYNKRIHHLQTEINTPRGTAIKAHMTVVIFSCR